MSDEQDFDFLEVVHGTMESLVGRIFGVMIALGLGCVVVVQLTKTEYYDFTEAMELFALGLATSILTGLGIVVFPALLLFAVGFVRYEWPYWSLVVFFGAPWLFYKPLI
jgi:hypothetical protein